MGGAVDERIQRMTIFPGSLRLFKGVTVLVDPNTSAVIDMNSLLYNPAGAGNQITQSIYSGISNK
jgi:hypothetical protein